MRGDVNMMSHMCSHMAVLFRPDCPTRAVQGTGNGLVALEDELRKPSRKVLRCIDGGGYCVSVRNAEKGTFQKQHSLALL